MFAITVPAINDQLGGRIDGDDPCPSTTESYRKQRYADTWYQ